MENKIYAISFFLLFISNHNLYTMEPVSFNGEEVSDKFLDLNNGNLKFNLNNFNLANNNISFPKAKQTITDSKYKNIQDISPQNSKTKKPV